MHENISKCFCKSLNLGTEVKKNEIKFSKKFSRSEIFFKFQDLDEPKAKSEKKNSKSQGLGQETKKLQKMLQVSGPVRGKKIK